MTKIAKPYSEAVASANGWQPDDYGQEIGSEGENTTSGIMLHVTRTITEHIPLTFGAKGKELNSIGQIIDAHLNEIAKDGGVASGVELEITPQAWFKYASGDRC